MFRKIALAGSLGIMGLAVYLFWLWQPERQVRLHTTHFLKKVERRNWDSAAAFVADDYSDRWGHNKTNGLADAREVFRQFIFLTIETRIDSCTVTGPNATARVTLKLQGNGGPFAQLITERLNALQQPFDFTWKKGSWKPWDWQLSHVDQSELQLEVGPWF